MAEGGLIESVLGAEGEERESESGLAAADAFAAAAAMDAARHDPALARKVGDYLDKQGRLIDLQLHHFDEERRLSIAAARRKRFADRIRNAFLAGAGLATLGVIALVGVVAWQSVNSRELIVEPISTPPDLAAKGVTGPMLAAQLQDRLNALQAATQSYLASARASGEAESPIKVEIPETGMSVDELGRAMRVWLGHDTRISGEVQHATGADGAPALAMTVRAGDEPGQRSLAPEQGVDALLQSAAEKVYERISPFRFVDWLKQNDRTAEARDLLIRLTEQGTAAQQASAEEGLASTDLGLSEDERWSHLQEAARLSPRDPVVQSSLAGAEERRGHTEAAYQIKKKVLTLPPAPGLSVAGAQVRQNQHLFNFEVTYGDWSSAIALATKDDVLQTQDPGEWSRQAAVAGARIYLHDLESARRFVQAGYVHVRRQSPATTTLLDSRRAAVRALLANGEGDWNGVLAEMTHLRDVDRFQNFLPWYSDIQQAYALARLGRLPEADVLMSGVPTDCYPCIRTRARIAEIKGDHAAADRWFAEAVRQGPSLPFADSEWGDALAARGQLDLAAARYAAAHAKSPHFADPLKGWGDVLARQGQMKAALAKYDEALKYAPAWAALLQARDLARRRSV